MATIKKKAKAKAKKPTKAKKSAGKKGKKEFNPIEVRKEIAQMVDSEAAEMAAAVIGEGKKGQLATVKYLFEVAEIYPPSTDGSQTTKDEDCFAKSLMDRLGLPDKPIALDDEEDEGVKSANPSVGEGGGEEAGGQESNPSEPEGSVADGEEHKHVSALV
jgi:hypothetical protein